MKAGRNVTAQRADNRTYVSYFISEDTMNDVTMIQRKRARIAANDELRTRRCKSLRKAENRIRHRTTKPRAHGKHDKRLMSIQDDETRFWECDCGEENCYFCGVQEYQY